MYHSDLQLQGIESTTSIQGGMGLTLQRLIETTRMSCLSYPVPAVSKTGPKSCSDFQVYSSQVKSTQVYSSLLKSTHFKFSEVRSTEGQIMAEERALRIIGLSKEDYRALSFECFSQAFNPELHSSEAESERPQKIQRDTKGDKKKVKEYLLLTPPPSPNKIMDNKLRMKEAFNYLARRWENKKKGAKPKRKIFINLQALLPEADGISD